MSTDEIRLSEAQLLHVNSSTPDALQLESTWAPGGKPPPTHWHPRQTEHFEVLEGRLTVRVAGDLRALGPGDVLDVPPGTPHAMWNAGDVPARATWLVTPALRTERMFRYVGGGMSLLRSIRMLLTFRNEFRLGGGGRRRGA
jgi:mannose-6-phosphate isomerase-like protein (cupin superfamily)